MRFRHLDEQLARAEDEPRVRVADAGGKLVERPGHAGVGIGAEEHLAGPKMALPRERGVADAGVMGAVLALELALGGVEFPMAVGIVDHVVKIRDVLLLDEVAEDIDVAIRHRIRGENVVVRDDDHFLPVPNLRVLAEFALEDADGARPANVVGHEHIHIHPDVIAGLDVGFAAGAGKQFFRQSHRTGKFSSAAGGFNREIWVCRFKLMIEFCQ